MIRILKKEIEYYFLLPASNKGVFKLVTCVQMLFKIHPYCVFTCQLIYAYLKTKKLNVRTLVIELLDIVVFHFINLE